LTAPRGGGDALQQADAVLDGIGALAQQGDRDADRRRELRERRGDQARDPHAPPARVRAGYK
jgi:hypothetical protein